MPSLLVAGGADRLWRKGLLLHQRLPVFPPAQMDGRLSCWYSSFFGGGLVHEESPAGSPASGDSVAARVGGSMPCGQVNGFSCPDVLNIQYGFCDWRHWSVTKVLCIARRF